MKPFKPYKRIYNITMLVPQSGHLTWQSTDCDLFNLERLGELYESKSEP